MARSFVLFEADINKRIASRVKTRNFTLEPNVVTVEFVGNAAALDALAADPLLAEKAREAAVKAVGEGVADIARTLKSYERMLDRVRTLEERDGFRLDFYDLYDEKVEAMHKAARKKAKSAFDKLAKLRDDYATFKVEAVARGTKAAAKSVGKKAATAVAMGAFTFGVGTLVGLMNEMRKIAWEGYTLLRAVEKDIRAIDDKLGKLGKLIADEKKGKKGMAKNASKMAASAVPGVNLAPSIKEIEKDIWRVRGKFAKIGTANHKAAAKLTTLLDQAAKLARDPAVAESDKLKAELAKVEKRTGEMLDAIADTEKMLEKSSRELDAMVRKFEDLKKAKDPSLAERACKTIVRHTPDAVKGFADRRIKPKLESLVAMKAGLENAAKAQAKKWM
ncbi:MAG: hypothetical protein D6754_07555 [Alphaproteobacteria bacterium]|nr:MAG: hypothetical protein D6754_07555 [Alphaproteobacteria bacterium]